MRAISLMSLLVPLLGSCAASGPSGRPVTPVPKVELAKYAGKWHEVAHFPKFFQRGCASATADYTPRPDGSIEVVNTCLKADGGRRSITGSAVPVDAAANRLKVTFSDSWYARLIPVPEDGNYWILAVTPGYQQAVVGTPDRKSLWLLSRSPQLPRAVYDRLVATAAAQGFDTARLVVDAHTRFVP